MIDVTGYLTPAEAARRLGLSVEMVRVWLKTGRIEHVRTPLGRLIPTAEVERIAAERQMRGGERRGAVTVSSGRRTDD
jgi:excisionase family DNA binding protein